MDAVSFTILVAPIVYAVAVGFSQAMQVFNKVLSIVELYMKRKFQGEARTTTDDQHHTNHSAQAKRRRQRRE